MTSGSHWNRRVVLVTGVTGFVGSGLATALVSKGAHVVGISRGFSAASPRFLEIASRVELVKSSLDDAGALAGLLGSRRVEVVFHLAGQAIVGAAQEEPVEAFEANVGGTLRVLEACRLRGGATRLVVASSIGVYGHCETARDETAPLSASSPYEASKRCAELLAASYHGTWRLPVAIARCATIYGGGDLSWSRLVPGTLRTLLSGEVPTLRTDGSPLRDYLFLDDAVEGYLAIARALHRPEVDGSCFNLASGTSISVLDAVRTLAEVADRTAQMPSPGPVPATRLDHRVSTERAKQLLGFTARTPFAAGAALTYDWYRRYLGGAERTR